MKRFILLSAFISLFSFWGYAQGSNANDLAKQANNPLASTKSISVHNIYTTSMYVVDGSMNSAWLRYAQPIGKVLIRASMPFNTFETKGIDKSGLGDFNIFGTYILSEPTSPNQYGIGPILTIPTATSSKLGAGKWQIGAAIAAYFAKSHILQSGLLATYQHSFAGDSDRSKVNILTIQPFFMWQLGKGLYLRSTGINVLDFEKSNYIIPLGLGLGKIITVNKIVFNLFAEPQYTIWHKGDGMPKVQIFIGINTQF